MQALIAGDVDMVLMDAASSRGYIGANPDKLKVIGEPLGTEEFGFIFTPGSDLATAFNAAIQTMKDDGFMEHLNYPLVLPVRSSPVNEQKPHGTPSNYSS